MPKKFPWNTSLDEILQSDSNVIVEDTGAGTVTINIDGSEVAVFDSSGLTVTGSISGDIDRLVESSQDVVVAYYGAGVSEIDFGQNDSSAARLKVYGGAGAQGGDIRVYAGTDNDSTNDFCQIRMSGDQFEIKTETGDALIKHDQSDETWTIVAGTNTLAEFDGPESEIRFGRGELRLGQEDLRQGELTLYGRGTGLTEGGRIELQVAADYDTSKNWYAISVVQDDLQIGPPNKNDAIKYEGGTDKIILTADGGGVELWHEPGGPVLKTVDITGGGIYAIELNGQGGRTAKWFFVSDNMAVANEEEDGLIQLNATKTGGSVINMFSGDPNGGASLFYNDFKTAETLSTGIIIGDGTQSSTQAITGGDTAQLKITGDDLDIQIDQASGKINFKDSGGSDMVAIGSTGLTLAAGATVNDIETTLTDDDTHLPTSGAVLDAISGFGSGDVVGPGSATDHAIARFNLATGKLIQNSLATIDDNGSINIPTGETYDINGTPLSASDVGAAPSSHGNANHSSTFITASDVTYGNLSANGDIGTGSNQVSQGDHSHGQLHTRLHAMTDILDHSANNWSIFHSNGAGQVIELPLGAANTVLQGNGVGAAPTMAQLTHSQIGTVGEDDHHSRSHSIAGASDHTATNWRIFSSNGAGQITEIALGVDNTYLKSTGASAAPGFEALDISDDASPTLGGDLVLDENSIKYIPGSLADTTAEGEVATMTIDAAADVAFGDLLFMASDFELEQADASASATMPVIAMSLGTGEGSQDVLLRGFVRDDLWNWSAGPIYASIATGLMTQTAPSGSGERVQRVGWAYSADVMFFDPDSTDIGVV